MKTLLGEKGLSTSGNKTDLIERLVSANLAQKIDEEIEPCDSASQTSKSHTSNTSSGSSIRTQRAVEAARRAELEARASVFKEKRRLLEEELQLKLRQEQLAIDEELAAATAREQAFTAVHEQCQDSEEHTSNYRFKEYFNSTSLPANSKFFEYDTRFQRITDAMLRQQQRSSLPKTEITTFDGDPMDYLMFIRSFVNRIETQTENDSERLYFLQQFTKGKPQEIVKGYTHLQPDRGYCDARAALDRKYGDQHRIASAYVEKLLSWPPIKSIDIDCLENLAILMRNCKNAMESIDDLNEVNHPKNLQRIIGKLPYQLQERWRQFVFKFSRQNKRADLGDMVHFVEEQVQIASDPVFGVNEMVRVKLTGERASKTVFFTAGTNSNLKCFVCGENHLIESCSVLQNMEMPEKIGKIKEKRLCFACLRPNHTSKQCKRRMQCLRCGKGHPTLLHVEQKASSSYFEQTGSEGKTAGYHVNKSKLCGATMPDDSNAVLPVIQEEV